MPCQSAQYRLPCTGPSYKAPPLTSTHATYPCSISNECVLARHVSGLLQASSPNRKGDIIGKLESLIGFPCAESGRSGQCGLSVGRTTQRHFTPSSWSMARRRSSESPSLKRAPARSKAPGRLPMSLRTSGILAGHLASSHLGTLTLRRRRLSLSCLLADSCAVPGSAEWALILDPQCPVVYQPSAVLEGHAGATGRTLRTWSGS